ncbi:hypothetical protein AVEN_204042-1 [Araneus ventricosus]|uniref:C2H2-type domain-containing protein n=1 Tax=Araneus ventricosus TaxID=182803 RepID=A0A4Y2RR78_ARAVE|nr:hypothetical protein AVEN_204042-1 [Araneus ventricosus]
MTNTYIYCFLSLADFSIMSFPIYARRFTDIKEQGSVISVLRQSGDPDGSAAVETELQKSNLNARPVLQDDRYNPSTALDVSLLQCMSGDLSAGDSLPTSSLKGTHTFEGPSDVDVEAQRRAKDRHFVCPISGKSNHRRVDFPVHFRTHTGEKAYACDMCARYEMWSGQI